MGFIFVVGVMLFCVGTSVAISAAVEGKFACALCGLVTLLIALKLIYESTINIIS